MLDNVLGFSSIEVEEAMVPRADIVAIPEKSTLNECIALFRKAAHSRLPVYKETLDEIIGMVHVKDILSYWHNDKDFVLSNIIRKKLDTVFMPSALPIIFIAALTVSEVVAIAPPIVPSASFILTIIAAKFSGSKTVDRAS